MPDIDLSDGFVDNPPSRRTVTPHLNELTAFANENNLTVGSTTGGRHNAHSKHYTGNAIDIKGSGGFDDAKVRELSQRAAEQGFKLRDERTRPAGQKVWGGPHVHIEYAGQDPSLASGFTDSNVDLSAGFVDEPVSTASTDTNPQSLVTALQQLTDSTNRVTRRMVRRLPVAQPARSTDLRSGLGLPAPVSQSLGANIPPVESGMGGLRRLDDPEAARIQRVQQQVTAEQTPVERQMSRAPGTANARLLEPHLNENEEVLRRVSDEQQQEADAARHAEWQRDNESEINRQTEAIRQSIRQKGGVDKWMMETASQGRAGLTNLAAGAVRRGGQLTGLLTGNPEATDEAANNMRISAEAAQRAATLEGADRNKVSKWAQGMTAGLISSAPAMGAMALGVPAPIAFGGQSALEASGEGANTAETLKAGAHGAATGAAFDLPVPGATRMVRRVPKALARAGTVAAGTAAVELGAGRSLPEALQSGATNAIMAGGGEILHGGQNARQAETQRQGVSAEQPAENPLELLQPAIQNTELGPMGTADGQAIPEAGGIDLSAGLIPEHHSASQPRRARNTEHGNKGQFKVGKVGGKPSDEPSYDITRPDGSTGQVTDSNLKHEMDQIPEGALLIIKSPSSGITYRWFKPFAAQGDSPNEVPVTNEAVAQQPKVQSSGGAEGRPVAKEPWQMTRKEWNNYHYDETKHRDLPADYFGDYESSIKKSATQPIETLPNGIEIRSAAHGIVYAFDGEKNVGMGDGKAFQVAPEYQHRGVGTALMRATLTGESVGSRTTAGANLIDSYHRNAVERALGEGRPIPPEVLADYPDLKVQSTGIGEETKPVPDWVKENIATTAEPAERSGLADKIEDLSRQRLTAKEVAARLNVDRDIVTAVRASRGIPSMDDKAEFDKWVNEAQPSAIPPLESSATGQLSAVLARKATPLEQRGGKPNQRGYSSIPPKEGFEVVYKPYGNSGDKSDAGYYYISAKINITNSAPKELSANQQNDLAWAKGVVSAADAGSPIAEAKRAQAERIIAKLEPVSVNEKQNAAIPPVESGLSAAEGSLRSPEQERIAAGTKRVGDAYVPPSAVNRAPSTAALDTFVESMSPMQRARAAAALSKQLRSNGEILTRAQIVERAIANGAKIETREAVDETARRKLQSEYDRTKGTYPFGNQNHPATIRFNEVKRQLADGGPKILVRRLVSPDGRSFRDEQTLSKTAMDYAEHLLSAKAEQSTTSQGSGNAPPRASEITESALPPTPNPPASPSTPVQAVGETAAPVPAGKLKERSFPETLAATGRAKGNDLYYQEVTDKASVDAANKRITADPEAARKFALEEGGSSKEKIATGLKLADQISSEAEAETDPAKAAEKHAQAIDLYSKLARDLTTAGQVVQSAQLAQRYTPSGAVIEATRAAQRGGGEDAKITVKDANLARELAAKHQKAEARIKELEKELDAAKNIPPPTRATRTKIGVKLEPFKVRLDKTAEEALARIAARTEKAKLELTGAKSERGAAITPAGVALDIADYAIVGAAKIAKGGLNFTQWSAEMVNDLGEDIKPHLNAIFKASKQHLDEQRKVFKEESAQRVAGKQLTRQGETPTIGKIQALRAEKAKLQIERRQARVDLERHFKAIEDAEKGKKTQIVTSVLRDNLLSVAGFMRILGGMGAKQVSDTLSRFGEGVIDTAEVRAAQAAGKTLPRTSVGPSFGGLFHTIKYAKNEGLPGIKNILRGKGSDIMPTHSGPTGNPYLDAALTPMSRLYGSKEQVIRSWAYPQEQYAQAEIMAKNDALDGLIKRGEIKTRTQEYLEGKGSFDGTRNQQYAESLAQKAAKYETDSKRIIPSYEEIRRDELKTSPRELIDSLAQQYADKQVYAEPSKVSSFVGGVRNQAAKVGMGKAFELAQADILPFVKRPANAVADAVYTYTGARIPVDAYKVISSRFGPAERASLHQAITRGGAGYGIFALGYLLAGQGLMTPGDDGKSRNIKEAAGYKPGALHISSRYYQMQNVPFFGWLLAAGATAKMNGFKSVPGAVARMILEHPLLRGLQELKGSVDEAANVAEGKSSVGTFAEKQGGKLLARGVPSLLNAVAEATDTKQRDTKSLLGPAKSRIPGVRQTLPVKKDVLNRDIPKSRFSPVDPFKSSSDRSTPGTTELIRLGMDIGKLQEETKGLHPKQVIPSKMETFRQANPAALSAVDRLVQTLGYQKASDDRKRELLRKIIDEVRTPYEKLRVPIGQRVATR